MEIMTTGATTIEGMIDSYAAYLREIHPAANFDRFELLRTSNHEGALAEAIVFGILQGLHLDPEVHDEVGSGGADFICARSSVSPALRGLVPPSRDDQLMVEATSLDPNAITDRSQLPNEVPDEIQGGAFSLITRSICNKVKDKTAQLGGSGMPAVLALVSSHAHIGLLFNTLGAESVLVSDQKIVIPIGSDGPGTGCTDLRSSAFLRCDSKRGVVPCRQTISAVLLIAVYGDHSEVFGVLHPEPAYPLKINCFPKVPFVRLSRWPITDSRISTEWVISDPDGLNAHHWPLRAT